MSAVSQVVGFVGLGMIGAPMAERILDAGFPLLAYDIRPESRDYFKAKGAAIASSPREVAEGAEIVLVSLPGPQEALEVALGDEGLIHGSKIRIYIDLSTTGPAMSRQVAKGLREKGIESLDAPVSGGAVGARTGKLAIMAAGSAETFERCLPILETFGKMVVHVADEVGLGQVMKLANNVLSGGAIVLTAEAMAFGVKEGLDPQKMLDVFNASSGMNTATRDKFPMSVLTGTYDYGFRAALMAKDLALALKRAEELGIPMVTGETVHRSFERVAKKDPTADFTSVAKEFEEMLDLDFRARPDNGR